jgi:serum/glucocorticoid-regulated kinase 2
MYRYICEKNFQEPKNASEEAKDLIRRLLERNPAQRLGCSPLGSQEIFDHPFFKDLDWEKVRNRQIQPLFKPVVTSDEDISNIDQEFTSEVPTDSIPDHSPLSETLQEYFKDFSYNGGDDIFFNNSISSLHEPSTSLNMIQEEIVPHRI